MTADTLTTTQLDDMPLDDLAAHVARLHPTCEAARVLARRALDVEAYALELERALGTINLEAAVKDYFT